MTDKLTLPPSVHHFRVLVLFAASRRRCCSSPGFILTFSRCCRSLPLLACVASASAFLTGPVAVPGTARFNGATMARSGLGLRAAKTGRAATLAPLRMQTATGVDTAALAKAANEARGLAMDSIAAAKSGHLGLPLGCAEVSHFQSLALFCECETMGL